jgi:hypothetical protein
MTDPTRTAPNALESLPELARRLGLSYPQAWRAASAGQFACIKTNRQYLAIPSDVANWAQQRRQGGGR